MTDPFVLIVSFSILGSQSVNSTGIVYLVVLVGTFFTGRNPAYYLVYAALKAMLLALIVWLAWRWPKVEA